MAKRHHASKRAKHAEHMGMERYERGPVKHHSSSKESHGGAMDPEHYKAPVRGSDRSVSQEGRSYRNISQGDYAGENARRTQEMQDAGMIHEDLSAIANLPQNVMIKSYPKTGPYNPEVLDDTIGGIDRQMDYDDSKRAMNFYPKKV